MKKRKAFSIRKIKILVLSLLISVSIIFFGILVSANEKKEGVPLYKYYTSVQIRPGDTLWSIASEYCHDSIQMKDYMKELKQINHLQGDNIHAGRYLTVVYYSEEYK